MDRSREAAILSEVEQAFNFGASRLRQKHQAEFKDFFTFELRSKCLSLAGLRDLTDRHCSIRAQAGLRAIPLRKQPPLVLVGMATAYLPGVLSTFNSRVG